MSTAINFTFSGGSYQSDGYTPIVDDGYGASGSNGVWRWDISHQNTRYDPGSSYWLEYTQSTGEWIAVGGSANDVIGTRNGDVITCGTFAVFDETSAFSDGTVPTSSGGGTSTEGSSYSATLEVNSSGGLVYTIPTSSSAGTYYLLKSSDGGVTWTQHGQNITHQGTSYTQDTIASFDQSLIWIIRSPTEDELDRWRSQKKVFCNFW